MRSIRWKVRPSYLTHFEQRDIRVISGPALSDEPLDRIVEALRLRRERSHNAAPLKRRDIIETARLDWVTVPTDGHNGRMMPTGRPPTKGTRRCRSGSDDRHECADPDVTL
jgi:hypothetical protein